MSCYLQLKFGCMGCYLRMIKYGVNPRHLLDFVILPVLTHMEDKCINSSSGLLLGIAAVETLCGRYLKQHHNGPAMGIFQVESSTEHDLFDNYLSHKPALKQKINSFKTSHKNLDSISNLAYQVAIARANLYRIPEPLPSEKDVLAMGLYWKKYWNTHLGAGTVDDFVLKYPEI